MACYHVGRRFLALSLTFQRSHVVLWNEMNLIIEPGGLGKGQDKTPGTLLTLEESFLFFE
jgi:hypothetical protein